MKRLNKVMVSLLAGLLLVAIAPAATASEKSDAAKERKATLEKFGLEEDPGPDPDPEKVFMRNGVAFTIIKLHRGDTRPPASGKEGWVRYRHMQAQDLEVYQENEDFVWIFYWKRTDQGPTVRQTKDDFGRTVEIADLPDDVIEAWRAFRDEFNEMMPDMAKRTVSFKQRSSGLASAGSWRNGGDTGDMNGDGFVDLVVPPQRGAASVPTIYLGDGKGGWSIWENASFPFATNYGSVSVGDLNGDGHLDIAQAVHLRGPIVYLGDGKGVFTDASEGLPGNFATRRIRIGDLDLDGDLDFVAISEGPIKGGGPNVTDGVKVKAFLNDGTGSNWTSVDVNEDPDRTLGGDWMELADVNGDGYLDIVGSSIYYGGRALVHLSTGPATWEVYGAVFPFESYYLGLTTGKFSGGERDEAVMGFQRNWRYEVDPDRVPPPARGLLSGLELVTWAEDGTATRKPIVRWLGVRQELGAVASGDFDGDGNLDIAFVDTDLIELSILLGDGKGQFAFATVDGVTLPNNDVYDILVTDVNADERADLVFLFEGTETRKSGSVRVYLGIGSEE